MRTALVIDDHPIAHLGCRQLLTERGYDPILEALNDNDALRLADLHMPDLIVLDLGMPGLGGLNLIAPLLRRVPEARILIFSMNEQTVFVSKAIEAGASGYLSKNSGPEEFFDALDALESGRLYLSHEMALAVAGTRAGGRADPLSSLTEREHQVLRLIGQGQDLQSVADALRISYKTAANTSASVKKKLGVKGTTDLVRYAIETGLTS